MSIIKLVAARWRVSYRSLLVLQELIGRGKKIEQKIQGYHGLSCDGYFFLMHEWHVKKISFSLWE